VEDPKKQNDAGVPTEVSVESQPLSEDDLETVSGGLSSTDTVSEPPTCIF
jgi:hypothetical protein